tara:strand:+ start:397 stop:639 length:243 start_codon:yes stop_codon:yes gene_type:complete
VKSQKNNTDNNFYVLQQNWIYLEMFLRCQTQWRVGLSGIIGLDYTSVVEMIKLYNIKDSVIMIEKIQIIESGALKAMSKE